MTTEHLLEKETDKNSDLYDAVEKIRALEKIIKKGEDNYTDLQKRNTFIQDRLSELLDENTRLGEKVASHQEEKDKEDKQGPLLESTEDVDRLFTLASENQSKAKKIEELQQTVRVMREEMMRKAEETERERVRALDEHIVSNPNTDRNNAVDSELLLQKVLEFTTYGMSIKDNDIPRERLRSGCEGYDSPILSRGQLNLPIQNVQQLSAALELSVLSTTFKDSTLRQKPISIIEKLKMEHKYAQTIEEPYLSNREYPQQQESLMGSIQISKLNFGVKTNTSSTQTENLHELDLRVVVTESIPTTIVQKEYILVHPVVSRDPALLTKTIKDETTYVRNTVPKLNLGTISLNLPSRTRQAQSTFRPTEPEIEMPPTARVQYTKFKEEEHKAELLKRASETEALEMVRIRPDQVLKFLEKADLVRKPTLVPKLEVSQKQVASKKKWAFDIAAHGLVQSEGGVPIRELRADIPLETDELNEIGEKGNAHLRASVNNGTSYIRLDLNSGKFKEMDVNPYENDKTSINIRKILKKDRGGVTTRRGSGLHRVDNVYSSVLVQSSCLEGHEDLNNDALNLSHFQKPSIKDELQAPFTILHQSENKKRTENKLKDFNTSPDLLPKDTHRRMQSGLELDKKKKLKNFFQTKAKTKPTEVT